MKKIVTLITILFILFATALPAFAAECEQHSVNYPAEPAYTHEMGIDIYECMNCGHEMWHCEECNKYMPIEEVQCTECDECRIAFNSSEENKIDTIIKDKKDDTVVYTILIIILAVAIICTALPI